MGFGIAQDVVHNTAAFDTCNDMFNEDADTGNDLILRFLFRTEFLISRLFLRLIGRDMLRFKPLEARILEKDTARWKRVVFFITNTFVVDASSIRATEVAYAMLLNINNEVVLHRVVFFF